MNCGICFGISDNGILLWRKKRAHVMFSNDTLAVADSQWLKKGGAVLLPCVLDGNPN